MREKLISRKAAIDAVATISEDPTAMHNGWIDPFYAMQKLKDLPSAQLEPLTGKWIEKEICETRRKEEMQTAKCSNCGKYLTTPYFYSFTHYSFCPNCGATMKGDTLK